MSNLPIFNADYLGGLLDPFVPDMSNYITIIKYESLTPDMWCLLFRTTGQSEDSGKVKSQDHFFVLVEYDFIPDLDEAKKIIEDWHGQILKFLPPKFEPPAAKSTLEQLSYSYDNAYKGLLAEVVRPRGEGYWATNFVIKPGESITASIAHLPQAQQTGIRKALGKLPQVNQDLLSEDTNTTGRSIIVFVKPGKGVELFF